MHSDYNVPTEKEARSVMCQIVPNGLKRSRGHSLRISARNPLLCGLTPGAAAKVA